PAPAILLGRLTYGYPRAQRAALEDVHIALWPGQFAAIVGANGAGKSTLARSIVRIVRPPPDSVRLRGVDVVQMSLADITAPGWLCIPVPRAPVRRSLSYSHGVDVVGPDHRPDEVRGGAHPSGARLPMHCVQ